LTYEDKSKTSKKLIRNFCGY